MLMRGACGRTLKLPSIWEGFAGITHEDRWLPTVLGSLFKAKAAKPTVRDERGACGNVGYGGTMNPSHIPKGCVSETLCLRLRAPYFYPTTRACAKGGSSGTGEIQMSSLPGRARYPVRIVKNERTGDRHLEV